MPVYDAANVPDTVGRGTLDPELAAWLPSGPVLGADVPIAQGRRDHMQLGAGPWPTRSSSAARTRRTAARRSAAPARIGSPGHAGCPDGPAAGGGWESRRPVSR